MDFGGVGSHDLRRFLALIQAMEGYDSVDTIVFARDAETDGARAEESVKYHFRTAGLPEPDHAFELTETAPRCGYMVFPGTRTPDTTGATSLAPGTLEDLCISSVSDDPLLTCVDSYIACAQQISGKPVIHVHKARLYAYLACKKDWAGLKLSEAARAGAWPWEHEVFAPFKLLIQSM
jgi:hypothetical protein